MFAARNMTFAGSGFSPASLMPLAYYDASNPTCYPGSGATVFDLSGNANDGTLTNGAAYSSSDGGVFALDGTNDFIDIAAFGSGAKLSAKTAFSCAFFVKQTNSQAAFFSYGESGVATNDILLAITGGTILAQVNNGSDGSGIFSYTLPAGYFHITLVFDGSQTGNANRLKLFINGAQQGLSFDYTVPSSTASPSSPQSRIGNYYSFPATWYLAGNIASGLIFDRAIIADEITKIYNHGRERLGL